MTRKKPIRIFYQYRLFVNLGFRLFPLNCCTRLRTHIITNSIDILHFVQNTICNLLKNCPVNLLNRSGHCVNCIDCTDNNRIFIAALIVFHTDRFKIRNDGEILPYFFIKTCANSSRRIASDSRTASRRSLVIAPRHLTPRPGPGNG